MTFRLLLRALPLVFLLTSCGVERPASMFRGGPFRAVASAEGESKVENKAEAKRRRAEARAAVAEADAKAREAAERAARQRHGQSLTPEEADLMARVEAIAEKERKREAKRQAKLEAKLAASRTLPPEGGSERKSANASGRNTGGWFAGLGLGKLSRRQPQGEHDIFVNQELLPSLTPANARIEITLGEQRARVYRKDGPVKALVIDTPISSGKPGHETPTGSFTISEKLVEKQSTLYGTWLDANGAPIPSSGESDRRPPGASRFVGADMPYWMRIRGGIGLHIGEVPGYPASHGCIRVPASVQPLIYSKVGLGTPVTVSY